MRITADHRDAGDPLLVAVAGALSALGAEVVVSRAGENLTRRLGARREFEIPPAAARAEGPPCAQVSVEGLANLLHEAGHIVLRQCLDDDHGIDYQAIPFDLGTPDGRDVLFEELACCVLSCAYLHEARWDAWFAEQVEIQPVFYGMDADSTGFWRAVRQCYADHTDEAEAVITVAYDRMGTLLRWWGAPATLAAPSRRVTLGEMLGRRFPAPYP